MKEEIKRLQLKDLKGIIENGWINYQLEDEEKVYSYD